MQWLKTFCFLQTFSFPNYVQLTVTNFPQALSGSLVYILDSCCCNVFFHLHSDSFSCFFFIFWFDILCVIFPFLDIGKIGKKTPWFERKLAKVISTVKETILVLIFPVARKVNSWWEGLLSHFTLSSEGGQDNHCQAGWQYLFCFKCSWVQCDYHNSYRLE